MRFVTDFEEGYYFGRLARAKLIGLRACKLN